MSASLGAVGLTDVVRYAGASGDLTALHYDPRAAKAAGHEQLFSMGLLHGGWLLSRLVEESRPADHAGGYQVTLTYQGIVPLDAALDLTVERTEGGATGQLQVAGRAAARGAVDWSPTPAVPAQGEDPQETSLPVEAGAVARFARAVRWPAPVLDGDPVPATFLATIAWYVDGDPFDRLGLDRTRTLAAGTSITYNAPVLVGETLRVRELVANRRIKQGKAGAMEFADLVTEFYDESGLRASYVNTFVQLPAAPEPEPEEATEPLRTGADFRLIGSHDAETGETYYPVRELSVDGHLRALTEVELSPSGTLYAFTSFLGQDYGQIDLPEGVRVQAPLAPGEHLIGSTYSITSPDGKAWCFARA